MGAQQRSAGSDDPARENCTRPGFAWRCTGALLLFIGAAGGGIPNTAAAEMVLCNGVWTNSPCEGVAERKVGADTTLTPEEAATVQEASRKRSILHEVTMRAIEAKREHGVDLSLETVQRLCRGQEASVDKCREAAEQLDSRLSQRITEAVAIASAKKANEAQDSPPPPAQTTVVIDERPVYVVGDRGYHHPHYNGSYSAGGAAISVQGSSSNGNLQVGVKTGGGYSEGGHSGYGHPGYGHPGYGHPRQHHPRNYHKPDHRRYEGPAPRTGGDVVVPGGHDVSQQQKIRTSASTGRPSSNSSVGSRAREPFSAGTRPSFR